MAFDKKKITQTEVWTVQEINEDNFVDRFRSYFRTHDKDWKILRPVDIGSENPYLRELSPTAHKWFAYLADKGFQKTYDYWKLCLTMRNQKIMVVCSDPADFDPLWDRA